jgi:hypothetical protein
MDRVEMTMLARMISWYNGEKFGMRLLEVSGEHARTNLTFIYTSKE